MSGLDRALLAEKTANVERHLARVEDQLPSDVTSFAPNTAASDAVILHLWQATQIVIDLGLSACLEFNLGTPANYGDAFERLRRASVIDDALAHSLKKAAGFRNLVAHAYESIDLARVHDAAKNGPADLRKFLRARRDKIASG